jgi:opacity protein-like surface antigen
MATLVSLALIAAAHAAEAHGTNEIRRDASAIVGASLGDGDTAATVSASLGFSFAHHFGVDFELSYAGHLEFMLDLCPAPGNCPVSEHTPVTGRTVSLVPHFVLDLASSSSRVHPYAIAGVGVTHLRQWYVLSPAVDRVDLGVPGVEIDTRSTERKRSKLAPTLAFGGGMSVRLSRNVALGADVRLMALFDEAPDGEQNMLALGTIATIRAGSRITLRF